MKVFSNKLVYDMGLRYDKEERVSYWIHYYCYNKKCPVRTEKEPWTRSDGELKWVKVKSKKGNWYKRRLNVCRHCGKVMTGTVSANTFA